MSDRTRGIVGLLLVLLVGCRRGVSTEPHIPRWVPVPEGVELRLVNWQVRDESVTGTAVGHVDFDGEEMLQFYGQRMDAQGFEVEAAPVLQGGDFAQLFARSSRRDRGLNVSLSGDGSLILSFSQER